MVHMHQPSIIQTHLVQGKNKKQRIYIIWLIYELQKGVVVGIL